MGLPVEHGAAREASERVAPVAPAASGTPRRAERRADGVWLVPAEAAEPERPPLRVRVVGPGRVERGYRETIEALDGQIETLDGQIEALDGELAGVRGELATARLVERGSQRLIDRIEEDLGRQRGENRELRQAQARLAVGLGALQTENEALRGECEALRRRVALLDAPPTRRSWFARLFGR